MKKAGTSHYTLAGDGALLDGQSLLGDGAFSLICYPIVIGASKRGQLWALIRGQ